MMNNGTYVVNRNNIKYIVNPEKGVIVGLCDISMYEYLRKFFEKTLKWEESNVLEYMVDEKYLRKQTYKAIAKCSGGDEFNEEFGMKLIEARIFRKVHANVMNMVDDYMNNIHKLDSKLSALFWRHKEKLDSIDKDLEEYFHVKH